MKNKKIDQIRTIARDKQCSPLTPDEKQWMKDNTKPGKGGIPVAICLATKPDYDEKLKTALKLQKKIPLNIINLTNPKNKKQ